MKKKTKEEEVLNERLLKLGKRIRDLRISKGYSSHEVFAYEHGIDRTQMGRYERGANLRYENLLKLMDAFGMTPKEFFSEGFDD